MSSKSFGIVCALVACIAIGGFVISFASAQTKSEPPADTSQQLEEAYRKIFEATKLQRDTYQKKLDEDHDRGKRVDALLTKYEQMSARQEEVAARMAKILDTWEKQQQQYQKYLDSLGKK